MMNSAQIGASGVLLIQYRLLKFGIDSAPMTTDYGIDLAVYSPKREMAVTVQVKTCLKPKAAGGKGKPALDWWLRHTSPAQLVGLVNLEEDQAWLFPHDDFVKKAQQKTKERLHFYFYTEPAYRARNGCHARDYEFFKIEHQIMPLFGVPSTSD